jgi:hypothetical protein
MSVTPAFAMAEQLDELLKGLLAALGEKVIQLKDPSGPAFVKSMLDARPSSWALPRAASAASTSWRPSSWARRASANLFTLYF